MNARWCFDDSLPQPVPSAAKREEPGADDSSGPVARVTGLDARIIPQRLFPLRKWYYANTLWYYHAPALTHRLVTDPRFYELVDPALRELCRLLLAAGLCTTPSCQGHFYPRERFERIWSELSREAGCIKNRGLQVRDAETNVAFQFRDADYELPWPSFAAFYEEAGANQNHGYLGVAVPSERLELISRLRTDAFTTAAARIAFDPELSRALDHVIFGVYVNPQTPEERDAAWSDLTAYFRAILRLSDEGKQR